MKWFPGRTGFLRGLKAVNLDSEYSYSDLDGDADNTDDSRFRLLDLMLKGRGQPAGPDDPHARVPVCITLAIRSYSALG